jgi:methionyl-tRNA formyltransferase
MAKINRVLFIGSKKLGLRVLQEMYSLSPETLIGILTIDDTNDTRTVFNDFQSFSNTNELELYVAKNRKRAEQIIRELNPDLCLVAGWYWLISKKTLDDVPHGFIGIHNSLLPEYRGGSPLIWAILNNEKEVGISFFSFTPGMDDGPIWVQGSVLVEKYDSISDVLRKLVDRTIEVLQEIYLQILNGSICPVEQNHDLATYCTQRYPNDGNINWHIPAQYVYNFIRAQSEPYPGAFTYFEGQILKIWQANIFEKTYYGMPGQVAKINSDSVCVICGDHQAIILEDVELNGQRGKAKDFIRSIKGRMFNLIEASVIKN